MNMKSLHVIRKETVLVSIDCSTNNIRVLLCMYVRKMLTEYVLYFVNSADHV
jgi:hypothetical protein